MSKYFNPFISKKKDFERDLEGMKVHWSQGSEKLKIRKEAILEDSIEQLPKLNLKKVLGFLIVCLNILGNEDYFY